MGVAWNLGDRPQNSKQPEQLAAKILCGQLPDKLQISVPVPNRLEKDFSGRNVGKCLRFVWSRVSQAVGDSELLDTIIGLLMADIKP